LIGALEVSPTLAMTKDRYSHLFHRTDDAAALSEAEIG